MPTLTSLLTFLAPSPTPAPAWRKSVSALVMPARFSRESRLVSFLAHEQAFARRQNCVDTDDLVLVLLDDHPTRAMLEQAGADVDLIRQAITRRMAAEPVEERIDGVLPKSSTLHKAWQDAHDVADSLRSPSITPAHLLLATVHDDTCLSKAARDLIASGFVRPIIVRVP
jgi:ATP-dependent Clp protease ATP-binding subunit ClpA